jgi:ketosteroid isomerase-like protein
MKGTRVRRFVLRAVFVGFVTTGLAACSGGTAPAPDKATADEVTATWSKAYNSGDAKAISALYSDDARLAPPGSRPIDGRAAIEAYWKDDIGAGGEVTTLTTGGSMAAGNLLQVNGAYEVKSKSGMPMARGQYVQLWRRDNGQWTVQEEMWRIDPAVQRDPVMADQFESRWTTAYNAGDAKALAALYDKDAVLSTKPTGSIEGKGAIEAFWKEDFGTGKPTTKLTLTDVYVAGEMAHLEGEYEVAERGKITNGHYVQLWMQDGEDWRIHREVWWR